MTTGVDSPVLAPDAVAPRGEASTPAGSSGSHAEPPPLPRTLTASPPPSPSPARASASPRRPRIRRGLLRDVVRGAFAVAVLHLFLIQVSIVRGDSMRPGLVDGDRLIVDRVSAAVAEFDRFDVVVLRNPSDPRVDYVKRVVGLPGDRVALRDGILTINGDAIDEDFGPVIDRVDFTSRVVPRDHCFVLGDNRPISRDSREFGMVPLDLVRGVVRVRFWPLDRVELF